MSAPGPSTAELTTLAALGLWLAPFVFGARIQLGAALGHRTWVSTAAGISVAYVFMDLLPQMGEMQERFSRAAEGHGLPFPAIRVYSAAMIGFMTFYVLENMVVFARARREHEGETHSLATYLTHILGFTVYCAVMGYLLHEESQESGIAMALYSLALFVHFWVLDHSLRAEHGARYDHSGRWIIAAGIAAGGAIGLTDLRSELMLPTLLGFVGGGVVINSLKEELPGKGEGRAVPFMAGAMGYSLLILLIDLE
jgi:hypothetical protein